MICGNCKQAGLALSIDHPAAVEASAKLHARCVGLQRPSATVARVTKGLTTWCDCQHATDKALVGNLVGNLVTGSQADMARKSLALLLPSIAAQPADLVGIWPVGGSQ